jgi:hypothetical protein
MIAPPKISREKGSSDSPSGTAAFHGSGVPKTIQVANQMAIASATMSLTKIERRTRLPIAPKATPTTATQAMRATDGTS